MNPLNNLERCLKGKQNNTINNTIPSLYNIPFSRTWTFPRDHWSLWCWRGPVGISSQPSGWPWLCHNGSSLLRLWRSPQGIRQQKYGLLWRSPVLHAPTCSGSPNVLNCIILSPYISSRYHFAAFVPVILFWWCSTPLSQRFLLETPWLYVPSSTFSVRCSHNAESTIKYMWDFI